MITKKQLKLLNDFLDDLDDKFNINSGGCCYIAYIIAKRLKKLNITFKIMISDNDSLSKFSTKHNESVYHVFLHIPYIGDINPMYGDYTKEYNLSLSELLRYYNNSTWNSRYDTNFNKYISNQINNFFKKL